MAQEDKREAAGMWQQFDREGDFRSVLERTGSCQLRKVMNNIYIAFSYKVCINIMGLRGIWSSDA